MKILIDMIARPKFRPVIFDHIMFKNAIEVILENTSADLAIKLVVLGTYVSYI